MDLKPRKISHKIFELRQKTHIWIEDHDGHYAVMTKNDLVGGMSQCITVHDSLIHARASMDAILAMFMPNIVEGTLQDVSEFDSKVVGHE